MECCLWLLNQAVLKTFMFPYFSINLDASSAFSGVSVKIRVHPHFLPPPLVVLGSAFGYGLTSSGLIGSSFTVSGSVAVASTVCRPKSDGPCGVVDGPGSSLAGKGQSVTADIRKSSSEKVFELNSCFGKPLNYVVFCECQSKSLVD